MTCFALFPTMPQIAVRADLLITICNVCEHLYIAMSEIFGIHTTAKYYGCRAEPHYLPASYYLGVQSADLCYTVFALNA